MSDLVAWLHTWQDLIGAALGVAGALIVAELVASAARWRDTRQALGHLIYDLQLYKAEANALHREAVLPKAVRSPRYHDTLAIIRQRPKLSPLFEHSLSKIHTLDNRLTTLPGAVWILVNGAENGFAHVEDVDNSLRRGEPTGYADEKFIEAIGVAITDMADAARWIDMALPRLASIYSAHFPTLRLARFAFRWNRGLDRVPRTSDLPGIAVRLEK